MGVAYDCGIEVLHYDFDLRLDLVGYPSRGGAFLTGSALGSALLGIGALWVFRALYFDQLAPIKHNGVFLRCRVREIHLLPLAHRLHFSDGILKKVRLMSTITLEG